MINISKELPIIGIYKITSPSNKIYIGQSVNILKRFKCYTNITNCKGQIKLKNSLDFYNPINHQFEIIEECNTINLNIRERYWQDYYDVLGPKGLNCRLTKTTDKSGKDSKETINRRVEKLNKTILQYSIEGNFIQEWPSALSVIKSIGFGNSNNINDCARGKYKTTYGFIWKYKNGDIKDFIPHVSSYKKLLYHLYINEEKIGLFEGWGGLQRFGLSNNIISKCINYGSFKQYKITT